MTSVLNLVATKDINMDKSAPAPITLRRRSKTDGLLESRSTPITCVITDGASNTLNKSTGGSGITLITEEGVTNSTVILQLTAAELAPFAIGNFASYEFLEGASDPKTLLLKGRLILE